MTFIKKGVTETLATYLGDVKLKNVLAVCWHLS